MKKMKLFHSNKEKCIFKLQQAQLVAPLTLTAIDRRASETTERSLQRNLKRVRLSEPVISRILLLKIKMCELINTFNN